MNILLTVHKVNIEIPHEEEPSYFHLYLYIQTQKRLEIRISGKNFW